MKKAAKRPKNAEEFDAYYEEHDIAELLGTRVKRINVDFPAAILRRLDMKARELGLARQGLLKYWIAERLDLVPKAR